MRSAWRVFAAVLGCALIVSVGCDSSQPESSSQATAAVSVSARAKSLLFSCYDVWQDQDFDGNPDVFLQTFCEETSTPAQHPVPWNYSIDISVIHKGSTVEETVISTTGLLGTSVKPGDGVEDFVSLTAYDPAVTPGGPHPDDDTTLGIYYLNTRTVSRGSQVYLSFLGLNLGTPNILTAPEPFEFTVVSGDTIIVRARKQALAASPSFLPFDPDPELIIQANLTVNGAGVTPSGSQTSSFADGAGMTFSYTVP
jgi:hypothetical protein